MTVVFRCDAAGCDLQVIGWAGTPEAPPAGWWQGEIAAGDDGPARVVGWTVHACSPAHLMAAVAAALAEGAGP